jgi:hypothetical protein
MSARTAEMLAADLDKHASERWRWRLLTLASLPSFVATVYLLRHVLR